MTELSAGAWRLYCFLARCRNQKTGKCCPSITLTMQIVGVKKSQVYRIRRELIDANWVRFTGDSAVWLKFFSPEEQMPSANTGGFVYIVTDGNGHYKIGYTTNLAQRLSALNMGLPTEMTVEIAYHSEHCQREEAKWHKRFADKRLKGEWFTLTAEDLTAIRNEAGSPINRTPRTGGIAVMPIPQNHTIGEQSDKSESSPVNDTPDSHKTVAESEKSEMHIRKNQQREPAKRTSKVEPLPVAVAPGSLDAKGCFSLFCELRQSVGGYEAPYQDKTADFVALAKLIKKSAAANWPITHERFEHAARNYFATPQGAHTVADLASRFSEFYKNALNQFKRPMATTNGALSDMSPQGQATVAAAQAWLKQKQEEFERTGKV